MDKGPIRESMIDAGNVHDSDRGNSINISQKKNDQLHGSTKIDKEGISWLESSVVNKSSSAQVT